MLRKVSGSIIFGLLLAANTTVMGSRTPGICPNVSIGYDVYKVMDQASLLSTHSWEYGTAAEAFLEFYNPEFSVFGDFPFPANGLPIPDPFIYSLSYAKPHISINSTTFIDGDGNFIPIIRKCFLANKICRCRWRSGISWSFRSPLRPDR